MTNYKLKKYLCPILGILIFIGCSTQKNTTIRNEELWHDISSIDQFVGKWEGKLNVPISKNDEIFMPESLIEVSITIEYTKGLQELMYNMKIDMNKLLTDCMDLDSIKEAGLTKDNLWELIIEGLENEDGFTIGGKYFANYDLSFDAEALFSDDSGSKFQINNNSDMIKLIFFEAISFGLGDEGFNEIVLNKK